MNQSSDDLVSRNALRENWMNIGLGNLGHGIFGLSLNQVLLHVVGLRDVTRLGNSTGIKNLTIIINLSLSIDTVLTSYTYVQSITRVLYSYT
jgi:hypothetical protein